MLPEFSIYLRMNDSYFNLLQILGPPSKFYWEQFLNQMGVNIFFNFDNVKQNFFVNEKRNCACNFFFNCPLLFNYFSPILRIAVTR